MKKSILLSSLIATAACLPVKTENSKSKHFVDSDLSPEKVEEALKADFALKINQTTNRLTYYKAGKVVDQWNIATADVTGEFHVVNGVAEKQSTPTGIFTAHDIEHCPSWFPRNPFNPKTGKIAASEEERQQIFRDNPQLFGACGKNNPLGQYALWFDGAYGAHGTAAEWILDLAVEDRRVSGGCIRNPNERIKQVFNDIVAAGLPDFKKQVDENLAKSLNERKTVTAWNIIPKVKVHVIVGNWDTDPALEGEEPKNTVTKKIQVEVPPAFEKLCTVKHVSPTHGKLEIYRQVPFKNVVGFYEIGQKVEILSSNGNFYKTARGYAHGGYMGDCVIQKPTMEWREIEVPIEEAEEAEEEKTENSEGEPSGEEESSSDATETENDK